MYKFIFFIIITLMFIAVIYNNTMAREGNLNVGMVVMYLLFMLVSLIDVGSDGGWHI